MGWATTLAISHQMFEQIYYGTNNLSTRDTLLSTIDALRMFLYETEYRMFMILYIFSLLDISGRASV